MVVTIHQPDFLPWLGFFDRWAKSALYIVLDDVQFIRRGWQHRDKIKTAHGIKWFTVPVIRNGRYLQQIKDVEISYQDEWMEARLNALHAAYAKAPNFISVYDRIKDAFSKRHRLLADLNMGLLKYCADMLQIETPLIFSSSLQKDLERTERLIHLVKAVGGDTYLTGLGSMDYLDEGAFIKEGIKVLWQNFDHPVYPQLHGDFQKNLSVLDFLMMVPDLKPGIQA